MHYTMHSKARPSLNAPAHGHHLQLMAKLLLICSPDWTRVVVQLNDFALCEERA